jgi:hypothetical protein
LLKIEGLNGGHVNRKQSIWHGRMEFGRATLGRVRLPREHLHCWRQRGRGGAARGQWRGGLLNFLTASRGRSRASETRPDRLGQAGRGPRCTPGHEYLTAPKHDQSPQWSSASPAGAFAGVLRNDSAQSSAFDSHVSGRHRAMGVGGRSPGRC